MSFHHFAFLTPGNFSAAAPGAGLEETLRLITEGEDLGFDSAWVRQRHLERGISSAATFLAAASQRTSRIGLGTAVIQLGYENPFRLAEDLATVEALSGGRLNAGFSDGPAPFAGLLGDVLPPLFAPDEPYGRAERLRHALSSPVLANEPLAGNAAGPQLPRLHPHVPALLDRLWYGAGSQRSAAWAGRSGFHLLTGNVITAEASEDFLAEQIRLIGTFRQSLPPAQTGRGRVAVGRVILPLDGAGPERREKFKAFAASRLERTRQPNGPRRTMFLPDIAGTLDEIAKALREDPVLQITGELRLELPYEFGIEDYRHILRRFAEIVPDLRAPSGPSQPAPVHAAHPSV